MAFLTKLFVFVCLTALFADGRRRPNSSNRDLVAVVQIFRHGQRTPGSFYTNDPYSDRSYWNGLDVGQLTNEGKRQHYALGQFSRHRYGDWLSPRYDKDDVYVYTTDMDRTHMSAQSNVHGLYPARGNQVWRQFSDWQAIPIHPIDSDVFSAFPSCTNYKVEYANNLATEEYVALDKNNAELYAYLTEKSGNNITTFTNTHVVSDCLKIESDVGLRLPQWTDTVYPQPLLELSALYFESYSHTTKMQRLGTGPFLYEILEHFDNMAEDPTSSQKYKIYSGHDFNIAATLNSFGAYSPPHNPAFASSIYIELRNRTGNYYVNVWSKDNDDFKQISIRGCALDCPLTEVKERLNDILIDVDTRNAECVESTSFVNPTAENIYKNLRAPGDLKW